MAWEVIEDQEYDAEPGERIRVSYTLTVPDYLTWTPDFIMDYLIKKLTPLAETINYEVLNKTGHKVDVQRIYVEVVVPGEVYKVYVEFVVLGTPVFVTAAVILGILAAVLIIFYLILDKVEKWTEEPGPLQWLVVAGTIALVALSAGYLIRSIR